MNEPLILEFSDQLDASQIHSNQEINPENNQQPTIALLHSYDLIDDFLDSLNITFETFCEEFVGSWTFGYINALKQAGIKTLLICISARVSQPSRFLHKPTDTPICVLPPPKPYILYRRLRRQSLTLYGATETQSFKDVQDSNSLRRSLLAPIKNLSRSMGAYLSTPLGTLARELRRENCRAMLCQEYEYGRFDSCVLLGQLLQIPVFATFQGGDRTQSWAEIPFRHLAFRRCAGVIVATQSEIQRIQSRYGVPSHKVARIFNPLNCKTWQGLSQEEARRALDIPATSKVVIWHGRVEIGRKGLDVLLHAWQKILARRADQPLQLILIGTGSEAEQLRQQIDAMQLQHVFWLNEFVHDREVIQRYLSAADLYVFPSRQEGFPVAPIEAMACGLPVVAAAAQGVNDIFEGGEASGGLVVPIGDYHAMAAAIGRLLDDSVLSQELGSRASYRVKTGFSIEVIGQQLKDILLQ